MGKMMFNFINNCSKISFSLTSEDDYHNLCNAVHNMEFDRNLAPYPLGM